MIFMYLCQNTVIRITGTNMYFIPDILFVSTIIFRIMVKLNNKSSVSEITIWPIVE